MEKLPEILRFYEDFYQVLKGFSKNKVEISKFKILPYLSRLELLSRDQQSSWFFLEILLKISEFIYLKSIFLLRFYQQQTPEQTPKNEEVKKTYEEVSDSEIFTQKYAFLLPFENILWEKVFLPVISLDKEIFFKKLKEKVFKEEGLNELIKVILEILKEEEEKAAILEKFPEKSIESYIEEIFDQLKVKKSVYFSEFLSSETDTLELVYYFLAILFMCFYGECVLVHNREGEDILILKK